MESQGKCADEARECTSACRCEIDAASRGNFCFGPDALDAELLQRHLFIL